MKVELNFPFSCIVCCFSSFGFSVKKNISIADNNEVIFVLAPQVNMEYTKCHKEQTTPTVGAALHMEMGRLNAVP